MGNPPTGTAGSRACHWNPQKVGADVQLEPAVLRRNEDRVPESLVVGPRREMRHPQTEFQRQFWSDFPGILDKALIGVVRDVVDAIEVGLPEIVQVSGQLVGIRIARSVNGLPDGIEYHLAVGVVVGWLGVPDPFIEEARF